MIARFSRHCALLAAIAAAISVSTSAFAQPPGGGRGGPGGGRGPGGGGGALELLRNDDVRNELGIVDDQVKEMEALVEEMRNRMRSIFEGMRDLPEEERREKFANIRETFSEERSKLEAKVKEIILPHQWDRLQQIHLQSQMSRGGGGSRVFIEGRVAEQLNITDEQKEQLREKAEAEEAKLREEITKLRQKAQDAIISVLSSEQQAKFKELVGEPIGFDLRSGGFGGRGGPQGGPRDGGRGDGGRGGEGGRRGGGRPDAE